jgi:hypothetical protein
MKIQIDTKEKTIKVEENVNLGELCKVLDKLLPKEWKGYCLLSGTVVNWTNPITWIFTQPSPIIPYIPIQPWQVGDITYKYNPIIDPGYTTCYNVEVMN